MKINNDLVTNLNGTAHIFNEITGQPNLWEATFKRVLFQKNEIAAFLKDILRIKNLQIILTGAGSSAFIGQILQYSFYKKTGISTQAIPTTDFVTHPEAYSQKTTPTLMVSFARSG